MPNAVDRIALALAAVGAANWGLVGAFMLDLVATLAGEGFGQVNPASRAVYGVVGLAGLALVAGRAGRKLRGGDGRAG